ncbi:hypothetical protein Q6350_03725 [Isoptericola sp. b515]|uniref:hypothetical protein n=1 Tax=Isoptericola sp. b515 TaxID=3064652 RepID=UPI002712CDC3|nr:hypothetical protein [Isoptericola sp. b515]MDO8147533.1 hypothetical protein [Isoptericola sp. b515]
MSIHRRLVAVTASCLVALGLTALPAHADGVVVTESDGVFQADGTYQASSTWAPGNTATLSASCSPDGDATVAVRFDATDEGVNMFDFFPTLEVWGLSDSGFIPAGTLGGSAAMRVVSGEKNTKATTASFFVATSGDLVIYPVTFEVPHLNCPSGKGAIPADGE